MSNLYSLFPQNLTYFQEVTLIAPLPSEGAAKDVGWGHAPLFKPETCKNASSSALKTYLQILATGFYNTLLYGRGSLDSKRGQGVVIESYSLDCKIIQQQSHNTGNTQMKRLLKPYIP
jgi:hypothetical protein